MGHPDSSVLTGAIGCSRQSGPTPTARPRFKTLKYCPTFPERFGSADAWAFAGAFFQHYNHHRHSGIGLHTPASVHFGTADEVREQRAKVRFRDDRSHARYWRTPGCSGAPWPSRRERPRAMMGATSTTICIRSRTTVPKLPMDRANSRHSPRAGRIRTS